MVTQTTVNRRRLLARAGAGAVAGMSGAFVGRARAQQFPSGPVTLIVPFPPGASTDVTFRLVAGKLSQMWGVPVVVDNKGGANGIIAAEAAARAKPDGHTLFTTSSMTHAGNPVLYDKLPYDPIKDFEPVTRMSMVPLVMLVHKGLKLKTLAELTALLKAQPGKHNFGSGAISARVAGELYRMLTGVDAVHVAYRNNQLAAPDLAAGTISFMVPDLSSAKMILQSGWADALAISQKDESPMLPGVPGADGAGLPGFIFTTWSAVYAPKGTPKEIVDRLNRDFIAAGTSPEINEKLLGMGGPMNPTTPDELRDFTLSEIEAWRKVVKAANIRIE